VWTEDADWALEEADAKQAQQAVLQCCPPR
jgi:hypothetical protein